MRPAEFDYNRATDLAGAARASAEGAVPLAGGQSLLPAMKLRQTAPARLVDLAELEELRGIERSGDGELRIGAMTRHRELAASQVVREFFPALARAASLIGDRQVRNRGTIGGNLCFAEPRANLPPVLIAGGATLEVTTGSASRSLPVEALFRGPRENSLAAGELLLRIAVPCEAALRGGYLELAPQRQGVPMLNVAAAVRPGGAIGVAAGGIDMTPRRLDAVEQVVSSGGGLAAALDAFDATALEAPTDVHATAAYRVRAARVLLSRVLAEIGID